MTLSEILDELVGDWSKPFKEPHSVEDVKEHRALYKTVLRLKLEAAQQIEKELLSLVPEKANQDTYFDPPPPAHLPDGSLIHHVMHQPSAREAHNKCVDDITKQIKEFCRK